MTSTFDCYRAARDQLLSLLPEDTDGWNSLSFPRLEGAFNWAHDWFDVVAEGQTRPALLIVKENGARTSVSYDEMRRRSNALAAFFSKHGVGRGDRVILMLGNQVELWEVMLAVMKVGAILLPTTTAAGTADLVDRVERAGVSTVVCNAADTVKFADVPGDYLRFSVGDASAWGLFNNGANSFSLVLPAVMAWVWVRALRRHRAEPASGNAEVATELVRLRTRRTRSVAVAVVRSRR